ncbi:hypothetical protein Q3G72_009796 [Acer saccharum]|nr:hypothetical protein Q3G72_009796 [Acer saccharum]
MMAKWVPLPVVTDGVVRDSKLTRLLRDSFGGIARTSLIVTIGPSPRHRGETASTILFGQREIGIAAMFDCGAHLASV